MSIACLGWGSLIWLQGSLPLMSKKPRWFTDGPKLPVEFARQSADGRMTLVIVPPEAAEPQPVLWAYLTCSSIADAHEALARREWGTRPLPQQWTSQDWINWKNRNVARWPELAGLSSAHTQQIETWANGKKLDEVVWTNLLAKYDGEDGRVPSLAEVLNYLKTLSGFNLSEAKKYVRNAPLQIRTNYRVAIESELGWTCDPSATLDEIC